MLYKVITEGCPQSYDEDLLDPVARKQENFNVFSGGFSTPFFLFGDGVQSLTNNIDSLGSLKSTFDYFLHSNQGICVNEKSIATVLKAWPSIVS